MTSKNNKSVQMTKFSLSCGDTGKLDNDLGDLENSGRFPVICGSSRGLLSSVARPPDPVPMDCAPVKLTQPMGHLPH